MSTTEQNAIAHLEARIKALEQRILQTPSRPVARPTGELRTTFQQAAHGFTVGRWIRKISSAWSLALFDQAHPSFLTSLQPVVGVVVEVPDANSFTVVSHGYVTDIPNPEDGIANNFVSGQIYFLSETLAGQVTEVPNSSRQICFHATGPRDGFVIQYSQPNAVLQNGITVTAPAAGQVILDPTGALANAAAVTDLLYLRVVVAPLTATEAITCKSGFCHLGAGVTGAQGYRWLDPTTPGALTATKPTTPVNQRPICVLYHFGGGYCWVNPPQIANPGIGDLWDVNPAAPANYQILIWDNTAKRYVPGLITGNSITPGAIASASLADFTGFSILAKPDTGSGPCSLLAAGTDQVLGRGPAGNLVFAKIVTTQITAKAVTAAELADALAYTVLGNGTNATASPTGITAPTDGTVLNRKGTTLAFTNDLQLGDVSTGGGTVDIWVSSSISVRVNSSGVITITHGASKTVTIDPAHLTGNYDIRFRELDYCNGATAQKRWILCDAGH